MNGFSIKSRIYFISFVFVVVSLIMSVMFFSLMREYNNLYNYILSLVSHHKSNNVNCLQHDATSELLKLLKEGKPPAKPSLYHTKWSFWFWAEGFPGPGQVSHPLEAFPNRFDTGWVFAVRANHVAAEARDPSYHFTKFRRRCRQRLATMRHRPHRLPFRSVENRLAVQVRTTPPQSTHEQCSPRNDHINRRAGHP